MEKKKTSPWVYVGIGCGVVLLLCVLAVVGIGWYGYSKAKQLEAELKDPVARTEKVRKVLGAESLPEGYHAVVGLTIPFVMEMAMLSDREPKMGGGAEGLGERGFIYLSLLSQAGPAAAARLLRGQDR